MSQWSYSLPQGIWDAEVEDLLNGTTSSPEHHGRTGPCDPEKLMSFLASLQVADPENIVKLAYQRQLHVFCKSLGEKLREVSDYLNTCKITHEEHMYSNLLSGLHSLYSTLCSDKEYKTAFSHHARCFNKLYTEIDNCNGPKDWAEDTNQTRLCKAYENIVDCYMIKSALHCGAQAADIFKKLFINVLRSTVVTDCGIRSLAHKSPCGSSKLTMSDVIVFLTLCAIIVFCLSCCWACCKAKKASGRKAS